MLNNPPGKDGNVRFITIPLKAFSDHVCIGYQCFCFFKLFVFICGFFGKVTCAFLDYEKVWRNSQKNKLFLSQKNCGTFLILFKPMFPGSPCISEIVMFAWRETLGVINSFKIEKTNFIFQASTILQHYFELLQNWKTTYIWRNVHSCFPVSETNWNIRVFIDLELLISISNVDTLKLEHH